MINTEKYKFKKIVIVGLARSGLASANLLCDLGAQVRVTESSDSDSIRANAAQLESRGIKVELGEHTGDFIKGNDLMVISPGVMPDAQPVLWARDLKIPVISEIEIAADLCPAKIIAVTGSSGKTTVTTLIGKIIEASGRRGFICGNIGIPFCAEVAKMRQGDYVSLEVSSFQLERTVKFKPDIALILNFAENHLDRHKDMREYLDAKKRIFRNQGQDDFLVLNAEAPALKAAASEAKSKVVFFSTGGGLNSNQAAVMTVGSILGIDKEIILEVFRDFKGIEHRMEFVAEINKVRFINDSKATLADSTIWALERIDSPVILIAGGRHKGIDYSLIKKTAEGKVKELIVIGEAKDNIRKDLEGFLRIEEAGSLKEAVEKAFSKASPGDCVLFSPMCSSFDMFSNYEERGMVFKESVHKLAGTN